MDSYSQKADHRPRYYKGRVNWLSRSHGFVLLQGQGPVFVHAAQLVQGFSPQDGDPVMFDYVEDPRLARYGCPGYAVQVRARQVQDCQRRPRSLASGKRPGARIRKIQAAEAEQQQAEQRAAHDVHSAVVDPREAEDQALQPHSRLECLVCLDAACSVAIYPCHHVCCCAECSNTLKTCPQCRSKVQFYFNLTGC